MNSEKFLLQCWLPIREAFRLPFISQFSWTDFSLLGIDKAYITQMPFLMHSTEFWKRGGLSPFPSATAGSVFDLWPQLLCKETCPCGGQCCVFCLRVSGTLRLVVLGRHGSPEVVTLAQGLLDGLAELS